MNSQRKHPVRVVLPLVVLALLLGVVAACAAGPLPPTPTAIPLAATATPTPRPTRPTATATVPQETPVAPVVTETVAAADESDAPLPGGGLSALDDRLAERTAQAFVARLVSGDSDGLSDLLLTDGARSGEAGRLLSQLYGTDPRLTDATLLEIRRATASSYEGRVLLRWASVDGGNEFTQAMTLTLGYQRGLWLIDDITLGERLEATSTPTPAPARSAASRRPRLGGRLVFQVSSGGDIYVINADGSGLQRLTDGLDPAWSPDGSQVAFTRWRHPWGLYLLDDGGSAEERLVDGVQLKEAAWSPDGSQLAFTVNRGSSDPITLCFFGYCFTLPPFSSAQIWLADLESGDLLSLPLDDQAVHAPTWSPARDRIVYAGDRGLAWIDLDSMETGRFTGGSAWDTSPTYSPDGQRIAYMGRVHNRWEVFVMNADGSGRSQLTYSDPALDPAPSNVAPAWSPDGQYIAFLSNRDGPWRLYLMRADGSDQRALFGARLDPLGIRYEWATERVLSWSK